MERPKRNLDAVAAHVRGELRQPHAALADLCDGLFDDLDQLAAAQRVEPAALPAPARALLVHREHMTAVLERHFGAPVELRVLRELRGERHYARRIELTLRPRGELVEVGAVWIEMRHLPPAAAAEVLSKHVPLGEILIRHNVLRRISPRWYFEFPAQTQIARAFRGGGRAYGRVGTIYCDDEPAIELLEVVSG